MRSFYFSGIYPLIVFAANQKKIGRVQLHYINVINTYQDPNYSDHSIEFPLLVSRIAELLGLGLISHQTFTWNCPPLELGIPFKLICKPDLSLRDNDLISSNISFLFENKQNINYAVISEGASDLNLLSVRGFLRNIITRKHLYLICGFYQPPLLFAILPWIHWTDHDALKPLFLKLINSNLLPCSFRDDYGDCDYIYFPSDEILPEFYLDYLKLQLKALDILPKNVLIKPHPRDTRSYQFYFFSLGIKAIVVDYKLRIFPAELFIEAFSLRCFGGLTSALLYTKPGHSTISLPAPPEIVKLYKMCYFGLIRLMRIVL